MTYEKTLQEGKDEFIRSFNSILETHRITDKHTGEIVIIDNVLPQMPDYLLDSFAAKIRAQTIEDGKEAIREIGRRKGFNQVREEALTALEALEKGV